MSLKVGVLFCYCLLLYGAGRSAYSQSERVLGRYAVQRWSAEEGLASGRISSLTQTPDGYLWIGTEKSLIRFDGYSFQPVTMPNGAAVASLTDLVVDRQGILWLRTEDAELLRVENDHVVTILSPKQGDQRIIAITAALQRGMLVSGLVEGVLRVDRGRPQRLDLKPPNLVISLSQAESGTMWLGTRGGGLFRSNGGSLSSIASIGQNTKVNCLLPSGSNGLWIGTDVDLLKLDAESKVVKKRLPAGGNVQVLAMAEDHEGQLWVGTSEGLLVLTGDRSQWVLHTGRAVTAVFSDREGNVWFGDGANLVRLRDTPVITYALPSALVHGGVGAVATDSHRRAWFAPLEGGLFWMLEGRPYPVTANGLNQDVIYSIDTYGNDIWLGRRRGGLTHLHTDRNGFRPETLTAKDGLPQGSIYAVRAMTDGSVWAAGLTGGVIHLTEGRIARYDRDQLGTGSVAAIEATTDGVVWFATSNGLIAFQSGVWTPLASTVNLPSQEILSLCADVHNGLYVGTSRGLVYLDGKHKNAESLSTALPNDPVLGIALDGHGTLWLSTTSQILSLPESARVSSPEMVAVREYTVADGLENSSGVRRTRSMVADTDGKVLFATEGGLSVARRRTGNAQVLALARIESISADGIPLPRSEIAHVPAGTRRITLNFAGLDLRAPEQVQLRYRLDDFDRNWSDPSKSREATYTNLQPGTYRFRLLARNSQGDWGPQESVLQVVIAPLLLQRWSFRILLMLFFLLLAAWLFHARINYVRVQMNILADARHAERNRIARELHDTLLQGIISVMLRLHVITEGIDQPAPARGALDNILDLMERVVEEARFAVQGLRNIESQAIDLETFFRDAEIDVLREASAVYRVEVKGDKRPLHLHICQEATRIGLEAIHNAIRHALPSLIAVQLVYAKESLTLQITDDGVGMEASLATNGREGHWGMLGMRERSKSIGGRLDIVSSIGEGTKVTLSIPAKFAYNRGRRSILPPRAPM